MVRAPSRRAIADEATSPRASHGRWSAPATCPSAKRDSGRVSAITTSAREHIDAVSRGSIKTAAAAPSHCVDSCTSASETRSLRTALNANPASAPATTSAKARRRVAISAVGDDLEVGPAIDVAARFRLVVADRLVRPVSDRLEARAIEAVLDGEVVDDGARPPLGQLDVARALPDVVGVALDADVGVAELGERLCKAVDQLLGIGVQFVRAGSEIDGDRLGQ